MRATREPQRPTAPREHGRDAVLLGGITAAVSATARRPPRHGGYARRYRIGTGVRVRNICGQRSAALVGVASASAGHRCRSHRAAACGSRPPHAERDLSSPSTVTSRQRGRVPPRVRGVATRQPAAVIRLRCAQDPVVVGTVDVCAKRISGPAPANCWPSGVSASECHRPGSRVSRLRRNGRAWTGTHDAL